MIGDIMNPSPDKGMIRKVFYNNDIHRNEQSFDASQIEMRRTCKYKPPLNISNLPSVFEMPKTNYNSIGGYYNDLNNNQNSPQVRYSKNNLQPIRHNRTNIKIVNDNPIEREQELKKHFRPQLKPIEIKDPRKTNNYQNNNDNKNSELLLELANKNLRFKSLEKFAKTSEYYHQMIQKKQSLQRRGEIIEQQNTLQEQEQTSMNNSMNNVKKLVQNQFVPNKNNMQTAYNTYDNPNQQIDKYAYCINEFVSLSSSNDKVLHIPTIKLYRMQKIPTDSAEEYINDWKVLDHSVLEIIAVFKNYPIGYDSVVSEMAPNGSISNLIKTIGTINERILQGIVIQMVPLIEYYNIRIRNHYDFIKTNNVHFDSKGNIVLHPSLRDDEKELGIFTTLKEKWSKVLKISQSKLHMKIDLFQLGIMLLDINLSIIDTRTETYLTQLTDDDYSNCDTCCCLYHFLSKKIQEFALIINNKLFSDDYIAFLCHITSFELTSSFSINKTKKEKWLKNKIFASNSLFNLLDVIKTAKVYDFLNEYYTPNNQIRNFDILCEEIRENLPFCEEYFNFYSIKNPNAIIHNKLLNYDELAKELRTDISTIHNRLLPIYSSYLIRADDTF